MTLRPYDHIAYTDADGQSWVQRLPDRIRRELLAERAIDALGARIATSAQVTDAASKALQSASAETPPAELIACWARDNTALFGIIADLIKDSDEAVTAVRRMLYIE